MDRLAPSLGVLGHRLHCVHSRLGGLELVPLLDHGTRFFEPLTQLLGSRIDRLQLDPAGRPAPDHPPEGGERHREPSGQKREAAVHRADATLPAASCPALRRDPIASGPGMAVRDRRKEKIGTVAPYEILLMLDPELPEERQTEIVSRTRELIEGSGGSWDAHDVWGRRKLAYEIDHKTDGAYHLLTFSAEPETLDEVSRVLKITDGVMRHLAVRRSERRPGGTVAPPPEDRQDEAQPARVASPQEQEEE
jgi:small subunit ribosomal protein S6